jgi:hypothetical protein
MLPEKDQQHKKIGTASPPLKKYLAETKYLKQFKIKIPHRN